MKRRILFVIVVLCVFTTINIVVDNPLCGAPPNPPKLYTCHNTGGVTSEIETFDCAIYDWVSKLPDGGAETCER